MDGGTGSEISKHCPNVLSEDSWTGAAQLKIPEVIQAIHTDYINSGAQIVTTNTYASNKHCLAADGVAERAIEANQIACAVAKRACKVKSDGNVFVFGSISTHPPCFKEAVQAATEKIANGGGEEARGVDCVNATSGVGGWPCRDQELENFRDQAGALVAGGVDAIALEMCKDLYHSSLVLQAAAETGVPVVLGITIKLDEQGQVYLRDERVLVADALREFLHLCPTIVAINVMHSPAEYCSAGLTAIREVWQGTIGCYPNNGTPSSWPNWSAGDLGEQELVDYAEQWAQQGATLIGGCCGIGPSHIKALADHFKDSKQTGGGCTEEASIFQVEEKTLEHQQSVPQSANNR